MKNFIKGFKKFCCGRVNFVLIFVIVLFVISFSFFYSFSVNRVKSIFVDQMYRQEELAISSGANSIHVFLEMAGNSLLLLSRNFSIVSQDPEGQKILDDFALDWVGTPVLGAARFDKDGVLLFMSNNIDEFSNITNDLVVHDRDYFIWAETATEGQIYLGKPLIPKVELSESQYIFPLITPIYNKEEFDGVLALAISLPKLTATYMEPLEVSPNSRVYLIHPDGTILAGPAESVELVGVNYFEYLRNKSYSGSEGALQRLTEAVEGLNQGKLDIILYSPIEKKPVRFLIAYHPVAFEEKQWTLGLAVPIDDAFVAFNLFKDSRIMIFSLFIFMIMTLSIVAILMAKIERRNAYIDGLEKGKKGKK